MVEAPCGRIGETAPEPPGRTGTGRPVTADVSDGWDILSVSRVEPWSSFTSPLNLQG